MIVSGFHSLSKVPFRTIPVTVTVTRYPTPNNGPGVVISFSYLSKNIFILNIIINIESDNSN